MLIKYLEKMYQELYEEKLNLEREIQKTSIAIRDNNQFIYTLEKLSDKSYESFSPREINHENYIKIDNLREEKLKYESIQKELNEKFSICNSHLVELESIRKIAKEKQDFIDEKMLQMEEDELFRQKILQTQELERQRIARDLHDSVIQSLANMIHKIEICSRLMDMDTIRCKLELQTMSKNVREVISDIRSVIYNLRPMSLDDIGLNETLEREISRICGQEKIKVDYKLEGNFENLIPIVSLTILRIVQEAINNVIKHANAKNVEIAIFYKKKNIEIIISDDGKGFEINLNKKNDLEKKDYSGFGISMMKERLYLLSGKIDIQSKKGKGTTIRATIPIIKEEN